MSRNYTQEQQIWKLWGFLQTIIKVLEEWISVDSNSSRVKIHYSASEISSGSLNIHSQRSDHWRHYPRSENRVNKVIFF